MAGDLTPNQMFTHEFNPVKGWPSPYALDKSAAWDSNETGIVRGMVLSLDASGNFVKGESTSGAVAVFAISGQDEFDANSDIGNISGGVLSGLVSLGGFEIQTSEYVDAAYAVNQCLTYATAGDIGKVTGGVAYTNTVVGVVTADAAANEHGISVLTFWTAWLPKTPA